VDGECADLCQVKLGRPHVLGPPRANVLDLGVMSAVWHDQHAVGIESQSRYLQVRVDLHKRSELVAIQWCVCVSQNALCVHLRRRRFLLLWCGRQSI
jgi:hypothetical protein